MRILIENGSHGMRNLGDIAMLQVAVHRLQGLWPHASIDVLTGDDDRLLKLCPNVRPVPERGSRIWSQGLKGYDNTCGPTGKLGKRLNWAWRRLVHHGDLRRFTFSLDQSEVVVASGGGYINDIFEPHAMRVLTILEAAIQSGKLTAMLGQGVGPLESPRLRAKATSVLPRVHLIGVREKHAGPAILESLGVESARVMVTGDDAIQPAYDRRPERLGTRLGFNLRVASYSMTGATHMDTIQSALKEAKVRYDVALVSLPVLSRGTNADHETIEKLLPTADGRIGCHEVLDDPADLIERIGHCRVVVTGSYHAGVFALAQGIPVIGLANSPYYVSKFQGLADQFGAGCEVVLLDGECLRERLAGAIDRAYASAERMRPQLLESAERQISAGRSFYQELAALSTSRR